MIIAQLFIRFMLLNTFYNSETSSVQTTNLDRKSKLYEHTLNPVNVLNDWLNPHHVILFNYFVYINLTGEWKEPPAAARRGCGGGEGHHAGKYEQGS